MDFLFSDLVSPRTPSTVLEHLLALGEKYEIVGLKAGAEKHLMDLVNMENCARYLTLADMHSAAQLKKTAMMEVVPHLAEVRKTQEWGKISPDLKEKILEEIGEHFQLL